MISKISSAECPKIVLRHMTHPVCKYNFLCAMVNLYLLWMKFWKNNWFCVTISRGLLSFVNHTVDNWRKNPGYCSARYNALLNLFISNIARKERRKSGNDFTSSKVPTIRKSLQICSNFLQLCSFTFCLQKYLYNQVFSL